MNKIYTKKIFIFLILVVLSLFISQSVLAQDNVKKADNIQNALDNSTKAINQAFGGGKAIDTTGGGTGDPFTYGLFEIINSLLTFAGFIFFLILIYGGYLWMFARGNEDQILRAKKITKEVILGIIIIVLARVFVEFILFQIGQSVKI